MKLSAAELALFQAVVDDVKPLKNSGRTTLQSKAPVVRRRRSQLPEITEDLKSFTELSDQLRSTVTPEQQLAYARPALPPKLLRDLKQGKIRQTVLLDLHGHTVEQARTSLAQTIATCLARGDRCLRIIHGKCKLQNTQTPILKNQVNNWLPQRPAVLAFCSAQPVDGGAGAVYVLLKRVYIKTD